MRVHLIKKKTIEKYIESATQSKNYFSYWLDVIKSAEWNEPSHIRTTFGSVDLLGKGTNRVVFNIGGNNYRMICQYFFGKAKVHLFVCWIGTHAEYDKLCNDGKQYSINTY